MEISTHSFIFQFLNDRNAVLRDMNGKNLNNDILSAKISSNLTIVVTIGQH